MMSGYLPRPDLWRLSEEAKNTPVLQCHGMISVMVMAQWRYQCFGMAFAEALLSFVRFIGPYGKALLGSPCPKNHRG